jgi:hypothetical protein
MSHSLHRRGSMESLRHDYLLLVTAASGINSANSKEKLRRVLDLVWEIGPINTGSNEVGTILSGVSVEEIKAGFTEVPRVRCVFDSEEKMREIIGRLIEMDLGISVTVSGPRAEVEKMCRDFGIKPHSANFSLDIWGRRAAPGGDSGVYHHVRPRHDLQGVGGRYHRAGQSGKDDARRGRGPHGKPLCVRLF